MEFDLDTVVANAQVEQAKQAPEAVNEAPEIQEVQAQENEQAAPQEPQGAPQEAPQEEGFQARNFRQLKEAAERERQAKKALEKEVAQLRKQFEQAQQAKEQTQPQSVDDDDLGIAEDDYAEGKHLKKLSKTTKQTMAEQQRLRQEIEAMRVEREIERTMPDFYQVVTKENVEAFAMMDPLQAEIIGSYPDVLKQSQAVYQAITRNNLHKMHDYDVQKQIIKKNQAMPKPAPETSQGGGTSPLGRAMETYSGDLTDEMKRMYYQQMKSAQKGRA